MDIHDEAPRGAIDRPDERDFRAEHVFGTVFDGELPKEVDLLKTKAHDQASTKHCTSYAVTHIHEILNTLEHGMSMRFNPEQQWNNQLVDPGTADERVGDYLISALKSLKKFGLDKNNENYPIKSYARLEKADFKKYLAGGLPIFTGMPVTSTNFKKAKYEGVWSGLDGEKVGGHAVCIVGYKEDRVEGTYYTALNSYGDTWGKFKSGTFLVKEKDLPSLFTSYIIYDAADLKYIYKDVTSESPMAEAIEWALNSQVARGYGDDPDPKNRTFLPDRPVTRAEMCQMLMNYHKFYHSNPSGHGK